MSELPSRAWVAIIALAGPLAARAEPLSSRDVVAEALAHNATLEAAVLDLRQSEAAVAVEAGRFWPTLVLDAGLTHLESPSLDASGGVTTGASDALALSAEVRHTFSFGTSLALTLDGSRSLDARPFGAGSGELVELGPAYGVSGRLSLTQPLLRGFGVEVGEAALRQARLGRDAAALTRERAASELLRDVLTAYWELWYATRAADLDGAAYALAVRQRDEAAQRVATGALAPVELLSFHTRVAELDQARVSSEGARRQRALALSALLGRAAPSSALVAADADGPSPPSPVGPEVWGDAEAASYDLKVSMNAVEAARERARVAGEADRPRLDLTAYVQAQGVGNQEVPPALEQLATLDAVSAHVGLAFELPLSSARREASTAQAGLALARAEAQLRAAEQQLRGAVETARVGLEEATLRLALGTTTATLAAESAAAQRERYARGDAILLEVYVAEDALRRAELGVARSRVDAEISVLRLDHLAGRLLMRRAAEVGR